MLRLTTTVLGSYDNNYNYSKIEVYGTSLYVWYGHDRQAVFSNKKRLLEHTVVFNVASYPFGLTRKLTFKTNPVTIR